MGGARSVVQTATQMAEINPPPLPHLLGLMASSCDLPEDVVIHILLLLPVMSLIRFKSVCKLWYALIESSNFIAKHTKSPNDILHKLLYFDDRDSYFTVSLVENNDSALPSYLDHSGLNEPRINLVACCNGIICLTSPNNVDVEHVDAALWNPATREFRLVPNSPFPCTLPHSRGHCTLTDIGFGFDVKTNDYKVVRMIHLSDIDQDLLGDHTRALTKIEVYSLNADSWSTIDVQLPFKFVEFDSGSRTDLNGIYCWMGKNDMQSGYSYQGMLSFDFSNQVFRTTQLPDICGIGVKFDVLGESIALVSHGTTYAVLGESIALIFVPLYESANYFEIWLLNGYGSAEESWTRAYTIGPLFEQVYNFMGVSRNGEFFCWELLNGQLVLRELVNQVTRNFRRVEYTPAIFYKESLVSIKRGNGVANMTHHAT